MAETIAKKYLDLEGLTTLVGKIRAEINEAKSEATAPLATATKAGVVIPGSGLKLTAATGKIDVDFTDVNASIEAAKAAAVKQAKDDLIAGAPATFDTLKEIADYIAEDKSGAAAMTEAIAGKADKATTLAGYGITDGVTKTAADAAYQPKGDYLTEHQSLAGYAKTTDVDTKLAPYAKTADVDTKLAPYAKTADFGSISAEEVNALFV